MGVILQDSAELAALVGAAKLSRYSSDDAEIAAAIADVEAEALSYVRRRYETELDDITPATATRILKSKTADIVLFEVARQTTDLVSEGVRQARDDAFTWLRGVADGRFVLDLATRPPADVSRPAVLSAKTEADMVFGHGGLDEW